MHKYITVIVQDGSKWAVNNMRWKDFDGHQIKIEYVPPPDFQEASLNSDKGFMDD
ncbi:MAG: hypothetical protein ACXWT3_02260 [Methylococcaceae bacterium]